jgi:sugar lactone lactonase YvrE
MKAPSRFSLFLAVLCLFVGSLSGCAPAPKAPEVHLYWPMPPERPRLELIKNYYTERDFEQSASDSAMTVLFGEAPDIVMGRPFDVASDSRNRVYVSDTGAGAVKMFDFATNTSKYVELDVQLGAVFGLWVDSSDKLYVVDGNLKQVLVFSPEYKYLRSYGSKKELGNPTQVALDEQRDRLFISDALKHQVQVYRLSDGSYLQAIGGEEETQAQARLYGPQGLAVNHKGHLFVCDMLNSRIVEYDTEGNFVSNFGELGDAIHQFEFPKDLAFDVDGNLHVLDIRKAAMLSYAQDGTFLLFTGAGKRTYNNFGFSMPSGIWIDSKNQLFIADQLARRFGKWLYLSEQYLEENPDFWKK